METALRPPRPALAGRIFHAFGGSAIKDRTRAWVLLGLLMPLVASLPATPAVAQPTRAVYEAALVGTAGGQQVRKGTAQATLDGDKIRLFTVFSGLDGPSGATVSAFLYRGHPAGGGELIENVGAGLPTTGGFEMTKTLTPPLLEDLRQGRLYLHVHVSNYSPRDELNGPFQLLSEEEPFMETRLSLVYQGHPTARGGMRAVVAGEGLRVMGYFNYLASDWRYITLYRDVPGAERAHLATIWNWGPWFMSGGFDLVVQPEAGWEDALHAGGISVEVVTSRESDRLRGRLLRTPNQAPAASQVLSPAAGETIPVGGVDGAGPVDPDAYLGTIAFSRASDPDGDPVEYLWQVSRRPGFETHDQTMTFDLGVDSTRVPLTVRFAAAIFDSLTNRQPGDILLGTPVTIYHRVLTTDGSVYTIGEAVATTFVRGTITSVDPGEDVPSGVSLEPSYPNPFNPSTRVAFTLKQHAFVRVGVYDGLGRRVAVLAEGEHQAGVHAVTWDAAGLASGTYLVRLEAPGFQETRAVTLAK